MSDKGNRISQVVENRQHIIKHCRGKMFTSESLKIVALICMLIDHAGATLFPQCDILRSIGRVSFPLYAFLLAQGCKHTHSMVNTNSALIKNRNHRWRIQIEGTFACPFPPHHEERNRERAG